MKGLVGGIPLALLVAAVANGHGQGLKEDGPVTVIGGPSGDDGGNNVAVEFAGSYNSGVKDRYKDDHSVNLKNTVVAHAPPHPPVRGSHKRHHPAVTVIGGPSGDDGGNSAEIEFDSSYASAVEDWYKDDHSHDVENHIITPPVHGFRRRGDPSVTLVGGPSGNDGGNSVEFEFDSSYASVVKDAYKDDHSVGIENHITHPPPAPGFRKRGDGDTTVIGGPSGNDGGNSAEIEFDSSYNSAVKDAYTDDHSVDIDDHIVQAAPSRGFHKRGGGDTTVIGGPSGDDGGNSASFEFDSSYASSVKDWYKDDHSVDVKNTVIHPPPVFHPPPVQGFRKRDDGGSHIGTPNSHKQGKAAEGDKSGASAKHGGVTLIKGPSGNDGGNSAEIEFDSKYASAVEDHYKDDHSVDIKNHVVAPPAVPKGFRKRGSDPVLLGGPSGDDEGNDADFVFDDDYSSTVDDHYVDDHSVKAENWIVHVPPPPSPPRPEPSHPQKPSFVPPYAQGPPPQATAPPFAGNPEPPQGVDPAASEPCTTSTFIETVIKTFADDPVATKPAAPYSPPEHSQAHVPQPYAPSEPSHGFEPTHPAEAVPTGGFPPHEVEPPKDHEKPGPQKPEPAHPSFTTSKVEGHPQPTVPSYPPQENLQEPPEDSAPTDPGPGQSEGDAFPCPSGKPGGHQPEHAAHEYQPHQTQGVDPQEAPKHAPTAVEPLTSITSTITVSYTSSFAVVPVYMDSSHKTSCTSGAHQRPTDVDAHNSHHAPSSAHSQAVKPTHHAAPSPTHSQTLFTGAAGRITPAAGVVSAMCGLMAVLAFVL
ncbi:hypothetical protein KXW28_008502 [Aspergillus fumigatus]|nr:hypothetical protein KXW28_008502 [Aspergillus fumigatus]